MGVPMPYGASICYYPRTGKLIVHHTVEQQRVIKNILEEINQTPKQVSIEAKFVEIAQEDLDTLGFEWDFIGGGVTYRGASSGTKQALVNARGGTRTGNFMLGLGSQAAGGTTAMSNGLRFASDIFTSVTGNADQIFNFYTVLGNYAFNTVIHALEQSKNTDVLSAPKVTTISGMTAQLRVTTQRRFATSWTEPEMNTETSSSLTGGNVTSYTPSVPDEWEEVSLGVLLDVTPTVAPDGYSIYLDMLPSITELVGYDTTYNTTALIDNNEVPMNYTTPIFTRREIRTQLVVYDNETVVMGGLIQEKLERFEDKIPLLGHLPVLGHLFTSRGEQSTKTNLMMFVNVRLVKPDGQPLRANEIRGLPDFRH